VLSAHFPDNLPRVLGVFGKKKMGKKEKKTLKRSESPTGLQKFCLQLLLSPFIINKIKGLSLASKLSLYRFIINKIHS
jgi:hypothetical protein